MSRDIQWTNQGKNDLFSCYIINTYTANQSTPPMLHRRKIKIVTICLFLFCFVFFKIWKTENGQEIDKHIFFLYNNCILCYKKKSPVWFPLIWINKILKVSNQSRSKSENSGIILISVLRKDKTHVTLCWRFVYLLSE